MKAAAGLSLAFTSGISASPLSRSFEEFKETCSKTYDTQGDELHAKECWKKSVNEVNQLNSASTTARFAVNCRSDLCPGDRPRGVPRPDVTNTDCDVMSDGDESWYIDWDEAGMVTPVKSQGNCSSCSFFATTGTIESKMLMEGMNVSLSELEIMSCSSHGPNCDEGWWPKYEYDWIINNNSGAVAAESNYPYDLPPQACATAELPDNALSPFTITSLKSYGASPKKLLYALQNEGPVAVDVWGSSTGFDKYESGVLTKANCSDDTGDGYNHEVLLVGYGYDTETGLTYWKIKNSWGTEIGENGFWRIAYGDGACGLSSPDQPGGLDGCVYAPQLSGPSTTAAPSTTTAAPTPPPTTTAPPHHDCDEVQPGCGQRMIWVPGCTGAGCLANGKDQDCAWCVYDLSTCEAHYGGACKNVQEAREKEGASCGPEILSV